MASESADLSPSERVHQVVTLFEDAWRQKRQPDLDEYLTAGQGERLSLLRELVLVDLWWRIQDGKDARVDDYLQRYPELLVDRNVLLELIRAECRYRKGVDPTLSLYEYRARYPELGGDPDRPRGAEACPEIPGYE